MTAMRVAIDIASSWSCVTYTNVVPTSRWICASSTCSRCRSFRSSAPSGSSSSSTAGRLTSARATATRCCWPPDSCPGSAVAELLEPDELERLLDPARATRTTGRAPSSGRSRRCRARVMCGKSAYDWKTVLTLRRCGGSASTRSSRIQISPLDGLTKPPIRFSVVVLPHPDGPSRQKNSPSPISRSVGPQRELRAVRFETSTSRIAAAVAHRVHPHEPRTTSRTSNVTSRRAGSSSPHRLDEQRWRPPRPTSRGSYATAVSGGSSSSAK